MNKSESCLIQVPFNKLVLKKKYMIETKGLIFTGTYYYKFGPSDVIGDMLGLGQPCFIDIKPTITDAMLICTAYDKFYDLKVKTE
jgi:hypothetical protein